MTDRGTLLALAFGALWLILIALTPAGLWVPDETVLYAATHKLWADGTLIVDNGHAQFGHPALLFNELLKAGPQGAVPQYPSGYSAAMVPFYALAGIKGLMAANALAAALSVWLTHRLALLLFDDARTALVAALLLGACSYLVVYAKSVWPHAIATAAVLACALFALRAIRAMPSWRRDAVLAGLVLGLGLSVRVDVVLIAPALLATALVVAPRPFVLIGLAALGALPGALLASWFNWLKFGQFFPVSYGSSGGGGTSLATYSVLAAGLLSVLTLCLAIRRWKDRPRTLGLIALAAVLALIVAVLALPALAPAKDALLRLLRGYYALWVDMRVVGDGGQATLHPDGTLTIFGLHKKAVAQSLPWMGLAALLITARPRAQTRFGLAVCALAILLWTPLFARISWHGGFTTNMRYFLPVVPFVCLLVAVAWRHLPPVSSRLSAGVWTGGIALATGAGFAMATLHPQPVVATLQHNLPLLAFAALACAALLSPLSRAIALLTRVLFATTITLGLMTTYAFDLATDIARRGLNARAEAVVSALPPDAFIYARIYEPMLFQIRRGDPIAARNRFTEALDPALIDRAMAAGFTVYVQSEILIDQVRATRPDLSLAPVFEDADLMVPIWRLDP